MKTIAGVVLSIFLASSGWAESKDDRSAPLQITLKAERIVTDANGSETAVADNTAEPGGLVQYRASYHNRGVLALRSVAPTLPIPAGMLVVPDSARPAPVWASLDGHTFERLPIRRIERLADGTAISREVPVSEFRALRWDAGILVPGDTFVVAVRTRVDAASR